MIIARKLLFFFTETKHTFVLMKFSTLYSAMKKKVIRIEWKS